MRLGRRQLIGADDADYGLLFEKTDGEGEPDHNKRRVKQGRKHEDDDERSAIAEQVANLAAGDESNDGTAHVSSLSPNAAGTNADPSPGPLPETGRGRWARSRSLMSDAVE